MMGKSNRISKKLLSVVLCVLLLICVPMTVFADGNTENVSAVYEAFILVQNALESGWFEELEVAVDGFYDVIDTFNDLNEEALEELAVLLEAEDGETVYSLILSDWIDANVVVSVGEVYNAYAEDPNKETATALIEMMDSYDEMYEGDRSLIESFFMGITDVYADAEALVADEENNTENNNTENNDTQNNNTQNNNVQDNSTGKSTDKTAGSTETKTVAALKTGDDSNVWMYLLVVVCGGMICGIIAKERKRRAVK